MLAAEKIDQTRRLLSEGKLSQRKIARLVGISRATVNAVALGRRPDYEARRLEQGQEEEPRGPVVRCPECGGKVYAPCRLCRVRKWKTLKRDAPEALRRRARERAIERLLAAVRKAGEQAAAVADKSYLPAAGAASDCK